MILCFMPKSEKDLVALEDRTQIQELQIKEKDPVQDGDLDTSANIDATMADFYEIYERLLNRICINLYLIVNENGFNQQRPYMPYGNAWQTLDTYEYNYLMSYEEIVQTVYQQCKEKELLIESPEHIMLINKYLMKVRYFDSYALPYLKEIMKMKDGTSGETLTIQQQSELQSQF